MELANSPSDTEASCTPTTTARCREEVSAISATI
jgi:hypothetical protein